MKQPADNFKITYTTTNSPANLAAMNDGFDAAIAQQRTKLHQEFSPVIGYGKKVGAWGHLDSINPSNTSEMLHRFGSFPVSALDEMVSLAVNAQKSWGAESWQNRVAVVRRAAAVIRERKMQLAAAVCLEVGKNRFESLGDVEEAADLLDYYAAQVESSDGYFSKLMSLLPGEETGSFLRPYGVFAVIAPFNFPVALAAGMAGAALLGGNSVILKPSEDTPWTGELLLGVMGDAGIPEGLFQVCQGPGDTVGAALVAHRDISGVAFTGSVNTGMAIHRQCASGRWIKPCLMELGGKNGAIIMPSANIDAAVEGCIKSAFGLSGQKCSALSRIIVHHDIKREFTARLLEFAATWKVGDATARDCNLGPVINAASVLRGERALALAKTRGGKILYRHETCSAGMNVNVDGNLDAARGHYVMPVIAELDPNHELMRQELFLPFAGLTTCHSLDEALGILNNTDFGLTAGIFSNEDTEILQFFDEAEAGVLYANRKTGATTGAWPGVQSFCGWKASGASGKGGCGPHYVAQFMREQSRTRMRG